MYTEESKISLVTVEYPSSILSVPFSIKLISSSYYGNCTCVLLWELYMTVSASISYQNVEEDLHDFEWTVFKMPHRKEVTIKNLFKVTE